MKDAEQSNEEIQKVKPGRILTTEFLPLVVG